MITAPGTAGLDLSMTGTGLCHEQVDGTGCTHLVTPSEARGDFRLPVIRDRVVTFLRGSELVLIEDIPPVRGHSLAILGMVHGVVREGLIREGIPYTTVTVSGLKKYATGKGGASKTEMAVAAYRRAGLEFADDNQCDAWWLWVMARDLLGSPVFELPKIQREALDKVKRVQRETSLGKLEG